MAVYSDEGIVLRTYKLGEADRIVVLLTPNHGKVRAVAKGVRKPKSRFGGRLEPPNNLSLLLYQGRELDLVSQVDIIECYPTIRSDLIRVHDALAMTEVVDQTAREGQADQALYNMLRGALRTLAYSERHSPFLLAGFYWKLLALEGAAPEVDRCVRCQRTDLAFTSFELSEGGVICESCHPSNNLDLAVLSVIRKILNGELAKVLEMDSVPLSLGVLDLSTRALEEHFERRLRAARFAIPAASGS